MPVERPPELSPAVGDLLHPARIVQDARELQNKIADLRHALHQEPEVGLQLPRTQAKVLAALEELPYEVTVGKSSTSVTAVLRGGARAASGSSPIVLLRADMDGLPVTESTGVEYASQIDGAMHACGHDLHTAMLLGAAELLADRRAEIAGDVVLMFQPGEEGFDGAAHMIREGVLDAAGRRADAAYALHVFSAMEPRGQFCIRPGVIMSASDGLFVEVIGAGGHGSAPHAALDPVTVTAEMITALQTMITRQFNMFDPVVLSVGRLDAGTHRGVIPERSRFEATIRTFSESSRSKMMAAIPKLLTGIASAHGLDVDVDYRPDYPLTVNTDTEVTNVETVIGQLFDDTRVTRWANPLSASEDFSRVLQEIPGAFIGLSATAGSRDHTTAPFNHSPDAMFDDAVLADGAALYATLALSRIAQLSAPASATTTSGVSCQS